MFDLELKTNLIAAGSPVIINGDEFENIEVHNLTIDAAGSEGNRSNGHDGKEQTTTPSRPDDATRVPPLVVASELDRQYSSGYGSESGDMLRELVKNKELLMKSVQRNNLSKCSSIDSDLSDASAMVRGSRVVTFIDRILKPQTILQLGLSPVSEQEISAKRISFFI